MTVAEAFARIEGWYQATTVPNRPQRNHNPGNLEFHSSMAAQYGATLETGVTHPRFAHFPTAEAGWQALNDLLSSPRYAGLTMEQAVNRFAPPCENQTVNYLHLVCQWTGRQASDLLGA
jgi:hypothetical protein